MTDQRADPMQDLRRLGRVRLLIRTTWRAEWERIRRLTPAEQEVHFESKRRAHGSWLDELWSDDTDGPQGVWCEFVQELSLSSDLTSALDLLGIPLHFYQTVMLYNKISRQLGIRPVIFLVKGGLYQALLPADSAPENAVAIYDRRTMSLKRC